MVNASPLSIRENGARGRNRTGTGGDPHWTPFLSQRRSPVRLPSSFVLPDDEGSRSDSPLERDFDLRNEHG